MGCWAATGAQKTLSVGLGWLPAVLLGAITAVGGGAVRDIVMRQVPAILGGNTLYATCALVASGVSGAAPPTGTRPPACSCGLVVGAGLCLLARWRGWILPSADAWSPADVVPARYRAARGGRARWRTPRPASAGRATEPTATGSRPVDRSEEP